MSHPKTSAAPGISPSQSDTVPLLSATPITDTPTPPSPPSQNPPEYSEPPTPFVRRVRFESPPPSLRSEADNESLLPSYAATTKYGKFSSEDEYLKALRAWAEEKTYMESGDTGLVGFYGKTTVEDYINRPGGGFRSQSKKERREKKSKKDGEGAQGGDSERGRKNSLSNWLNRKRSGSRAE